MTTSWSDATDPFGRQTREFIVERSGEPTVSGALWRPEDPSPDTPMVLFGHGVLHDRYHLPIPYLAQRFADELGWFSLAMDGPGHGLRGDEDSTEEVRLAALRSSTILDEAVDDWNVAISVVREQEVAEQSALAYFGLSMGTMFGMPLIAGRDDVVVATLGLLGTTGAGERFASEFLTAANSITCPVMYIMQLEDELFPREGYLELYDAIASDDKRLHANSGGHSAVTLEEIDFAYHFIRRHLGGTAPTRFVHEA